MPDEKNKCQLGQNTLTRMFKSLIPHEERDSMGKKKAAMGHRCLHVYEYSITLFLCLWQRGQNGDDRNSQTHICLDPSK